MRIRKGWLIFAAVGGAFGLYAAGYSPPKYIIYNPTESVPPGFYWIERGTMPQVGDFALIAPPEDAAALLAARGYLPRGLPLVKPIAAAEGDTICRDGERVTVNGRAIAAALPQDDQGRDLPVWTGCRQLHKGEYFALSTYHPHSLDGRYFGPWQAANIIGKADPLWTQ